jgi:hypothetical protein
VGVPVPAALAKDYERLSGTVVGLHYFVAFACLSLHRARVG